MDWSALAYARSWLAGLLVALSMSTGCAPLPDDEAAWVLEDLAAGEGESRLKQHTPDPFLFQYSIGGSSRVSVVVT